MHHPVEVASRSKPQKKMAPTNVCGAKVMITREADARRTPITKSIDARLIANPRRKKNPTRGHRAGLSRCGESPGEFSDNKPKFADVLPTRSDGQHRTEDYLPKSEAPRRLPSKGSRSRLVWTTCWLLPADIPNTFTNERF
jgi:hypothetical protein